MVPIFVLDDEEIVRPVDITCMVEIAPGPFNEELDAQAVIDLAEYHNARIVLGDSYRISDRWIKSLKDHGLTVVLIDDLGIGGNAHMRIDYSPIPKQPGGDAVELLGPSYFLTDSPWVPARSGPPKTMVAHAGWTGDFAAAESVYGSASEMARERGLQLTWIAPDQPTFDWLTVRGLVDVRDEVVNWKKERCTLWSKFDIVVGPASTSLFETIMQGAVPVSFPIAATQSSDREQWMTIGHALHLSRAEIKTGSIVDAIVELAFTHHAEFRAALDRFAAELDGGGAARVAEAVTTIADGGQRVSAQSKNVRASIRSCDLRDAHSFLIARNAPRVRALSTDPDYVISWSEHLIWWLTNTTERFVVEGEAGPEVFFWHRSKQFDGRYYLIGGWFPADDRPAFAAAIRLLDWQLEYCAERYPNHIWVATIHNTNRAVLELNRRYGFVEGDASTRRAAEHLFPGTTKDFTVLQRKAAP